MALRTMTITGTALLALASTAMADWDPSLDQTYLLNNGDAFTLNEGESITFTVEVAPSDLQVIGFSFSGVISGLLPFGQFPPLSSWTQMTIETPTELQYTVGGVSGFDNEWDFASVFDGLQKHGVGGEAYGGDGLPDFAFDHVPAGGEWSFTFLQTQADNISWQDVEITLHHAAVPAPGVLAAFGLLGLQRRRRRA